MTNFFNSEPMKYWATPAGMSPEKKRDHLNRMIDSGDYIWSEKIDGNWTRIIISKDRSAMQTRGISKQTGEYGEIQDKVFFWNDILNAFDNTTVFLGEVYLENGIDKDVGSILRSLKNKALSIQSNEYYNDCLKNGVRFSAKDKRDINDNVFKNCKLKLNIFDVLCYEGVELIDCPFKDRINYIDTVVRKINNSLVKGSKYNQMDENFYSDIDKIFSNGGEGVVCSSKNMKYIPGKRGPSAWDTVKVKQEIMNDIDCFIIGTEPATRLYTGKEIENWQYWENIRTHEKINDYKYSDYKMGATIEPVTRNYFFNYCGAIKVGVFDNNKNIIELCKVSGITDELKEGLRDNYDEWDHCPLTIGGMMVSSDMSIRHPILKSIRKNDINIEDCTLSKIAD